MDTITIKSFESIIKYSGFGHLTESNSSSLGNGLIIFKPNHPYLYYALEEMSNTYYPGG